MIDSGRFSQISDYRLKHSQGASFSHTISHTGKSCSIYSFDLSSSFHLLIHQAPPSHSHPLFLPAGHIALSVSVASWEFQRAGFPVDVSPPDRNIERMRDKKKQNGHKMETKNTLQKCRRKGSTLETTFMNWCCLVLYTCRDRRVDASRGSNLQPPSPSN